MANYIDDEYRIRRQISNESNMSQVFFCTDDNDEECAIKLFNRFEGNEDSQKLQETIFYREVEILQKVSHINIVKYKDSGQDDHLGKFYIALEYINGRNLRDALSDVSSYDEYSKLELIDQILSGVEYLHKKNIIHRDLKPSNIMLDENGIVKIIDFGISKFSESYYNEYTVLASKTLPYCSPEQEENKKATVRSDIYSLGLIFYEVFTGEKADKEKGLGNSYYEALPDNIREMLAKMLKREPSLRYGSVTEIRRDITIIKNKINQEKFLIIGITKSVAGLLYQNGYITRDEVAFAAVAANNDLQGRCYIKSQKSEKTGEFSYQFIGKQFIFICKRDNYNKERFTIVTVRFRNVADILMLKEMAYELPYGIKVQASAPNIKAANEMEIDSVLDELMKFEQDFSAHKNTRLRNREIVDKWFEILKLERKKLTEEKASLGYKGFKVIDDEYLEVYLEKVVPIDDVKFDTENMLQMTAKGKKGRDYNVGYMRDYYNGILTIGLAADVDPNMIASFGEVSINMNMVEIALRRQEQALKNIRFKECANPVISDIIFNPETATSKNNELLSEKDCHSDKIDKSKLKSLEKALSADNLFLLQGPPGTGKTTFISELVCQILDRNPDSKILIASQSHVAVDHSLTQIKELVPEIKLIRIGQKDKFSESVSDYTLERFCKEWTQQVIDCCNNAIQEYKKEIGLDSTLQEKTSIIAEIERLQEAIVSMQIELEAIDKEKEKLNVLNKKWKTIIDAVDNMKSNIKVESNSISNHVLLDILDTFIFKLDSMKQSLGDILDESVQLSSQLELLEKRKLELDGTIVQGKRDIADWKEMLGISDDTVEYEKYKKEIQQKTKENQSKYDKFSKIELLCKEWIKRVQQGEGLLQESLIDATVVGATCLGIASLKIDYKFDWVIIDEAGKATPTEILVPICLGKKIVLVGDHKQLPPVVDETILEMGETDLEKIDLETSLFEYMEQSLSPSCKSILDEQYRMHPIIGQLISTMFYSETPLVSKTTKEEKTIPLKLYDNKALVWLSTCYAEGNKEEKIGVTFRNRCEAKLIFNQILQIEEELKAQNLKKEVAIIAGYKAQKDLLRSIYQSQYETRFHNITVEINTVDAFQGRETDIVFYSVVRSNEKGNLGFLKDMRRLNVAFSRARELLIVVGNHHCASKNLTFANGKNNSFVGIVQFIVDHEEECCLLEVK